MVVTFIPEEIRTITWLTNFDNYKPPDCGRRDSAKTFEGFNVFGDRSNSGQRESKSSPIAF